MEAQDLGDCAGLAPDLAAITRVAAVEVGDAANAHRVRISTRQHGGTRRGAHPAKPHDKRLTD